jgi:hypothetical protein
MAFAIDAFFAGRAVRMTRTAAATCSGSISCIWFDTTAGFRYWNGTASLYVAATTESAHTKGKILVGDGTNWVSVSPGTLNQVLVSEPTDMGGPTGLVWKSPADGGLIPVVH